DIQSDINVFFFFFSSRRRHTRFKCDWSSDVCSSDLTTILTFGLVFLVPSLKARPATRNTRPKVRIVVLTVPALAVRAISLMSSEIGRASCRESVEMMLGAGGVE